MSAHRQIQDFLVAALAAAPDLTDGGVFANTLDPLPQEVDSQIVVRLLGTAAPSQQILRGPYDWQTQFVVEASKRVPQGSDPVATIDSLIGSVWSRIAALPAQSVGLGVLQVILQPAITWEVERLDTLVITSTLRLTVQHRTAATTLEAA
ncbi:MAG: hypothetical protein ACOYMX_03480 [Burkholderiales bacterium]